MVDGKRMAGGRNVIGRRGDDMGRRGGVRQENKNMKNGATTKRRGELHNDSFGN